MFIDATDTVAGMGLYEKTGKTLVYTAKVNLPFYENKLKTLKFILHERKQVNGDRVTGIHSWQVGKMVDVVLETEEGSLTGTYLIKSISETNELDLEPISVYMANEVILEE